MLQRVTPFRQLARIYGAVLAAAANTGRLIESQEATIDALHKAVAVPPTVLPPITDQPDTDMLLRVLVERGDFLCSKQSTLSAQASASEAAQLRSSIAARFPDNPATKGWNTYAQCDEDGIIRECLNRISTAAPLSKTFVEVGCADGIENNTHQLALDGYRGCWLDGDPEKIAYIAEQIGSLRNEVLYVVQGFATMETIRPLMQSFVDYLGTIDIDFFSFDIDGNDTYLVKESLGLLRPKLICVEYNGKFPPPTRLNMTYKDDHRWASDDYYGATLQTWIETLPGYRLVACNLSGVNAFFVRDDLARVFTLYEPAELYQPPRYWLTGSKGHRATLRWLRQVCTSESTR